MARRGAVWRGVTWRGVARRGVTLRGAVERRDTWQFVCTTADKWRSYNTHGRSIIASIMQAIWRFLNSQAELTARPGRDGRQKETEGSKMVNSVEATTLRWS